VNKALFEAVAVALAARTEAERAELVRRKEQVTAGLAAKLRDPDFVQAISVSTGSYSRVQARFAGVEAVLREALA
jgi:hypothetical protein